MSAYRPNRRDKIVVILANLVLRLATPEYQALLKRLIVGGMRSAEETIK